ncbi:DUF5131 family protein [bacterium]|nr:DUF5131 family protein [bacterium]
MSPIPHKIAYVTATWNPVTGCPGPKISRGCDNCFAERMAKRLRGRCGYRADDPFRATMHEDRLNQPALRRRPTRYLVSDMGDLWHDDVLNPWRNRVFNAALASTRHRFLFLSKRFTNMGKYILDLLFLDTVPPPHIALGLTACTQDELNRALETLSRLSLMGWHTWLSLEPLLEPVDLYHATQETTAPDWVVLGGEKAQAPRDMEPDWARAIRDDCAVLEIPFFMKQMATKVGPGLTPPAIPGDLFIRQIPQTLRLPGEIDHA